MAQELRPEESSENLASGARVGSQTRRIRLMNSMKRKWREGKVRPIPGNVPHDRLVSRGYWIRSPRNVCDDPFRVTPFALLQRTLRPRCAFLRHGGIYLVRCGFQIKTKPWGGTLPPPVGRARAQVKERGGRAALHLIGRGLVPAGYFLIGVLASIARLSFTGT